MEITTAYTILPISKGLGGEGGFLIITDFQEPMQNHLGIDYPPLPKKIAELLVEDINEILLEDTLLEEVKNQKKSNPEEVTLHPNFRFIRQEQERMSFSVCVQNTLLAMENEPDFSVQLDRLIQWDFLYRMSSGPKEKMKQIIAARHAIKWLGKDWKDLQGNYAGSLEEMEELEIPFVSQELIDRLKIELESMNLEEKVAVYFLFEFFQRFSITMSILWVKGIIRGCKVEDSYFVFAADLSPEEIKKIRAEEGNLVQRRLSHLKKYLNAVKSIQKKQKYPL